MPFVLDASIAACWALTDEDHRTAALALKRIQSDQALAPGLLWFEVRNILIVNERRRRITPRETARFLEFLSKLRLLLDGSPEESHALQLARVHGITFYDASYLELALRERLPLATLDRELARAAQAEGVLLLGG